MLLATLAAAFLLRLYGISWGLPDVYEEATPLREAWRMWGWGPGVGFDPYPHFFNYPSLTIYCHLLGQGVLYIGMRLSGAVHSTADFAALYTADPTSFLITGRLITALFGAGTVLVLYRLCRKIVSPLAAMSGAFFLAISTFHIEKSQLVEVDVPLAFFCTLALLFILRIAERPSRRNHLIAGLFIGLALSVKYTAVLLVIPLVVSHLLAGRAIRHHGSVRSGGVGRKWVDLALALAAIAGTFFITSPFVLLDFSTFREHLSIEQVHMREGHFGLERSGTVLFYIRALSERIIGWPLLILLAGGIVYRIGRHRKPPELILLSFAVPYCIVLATWAMKADRYLMPILPVILIFAAAAFDVCLRLPAMAEGKRRIAVAAVLFLAAVLPLAASYPAHIEGYAPDSRTLAREWIEGNVPSGAFIVTESYGPELLGPHLLLSLDREIRTALLRRTSDRPQYAVQPLPMMQVYPERTVAFYDLRLYPDVDIFITSAAITSRYRREPERFSGHIAFYRALDEHFVRIGEFEGGRGPKVTIYKTRERNVPFAGRKSVVGPRPLRPSKISGTEALFYSNLGANYEAFRYYEEANSCYDMALDYPLVRPSWFSEIVIGKTRALMALGRAEEAISFLRGAAERAPSAGMRERVMGLIRSIREEDTGGGE